MVSILFTGHSVKQDRIIILAAAGNAEIER